MDRSKFHILEDGCQAFGVTLTEKQIEQFEKYYELLVEWNKVMNLTGITEFDEVMQKHFVDSVAAAEYVEMEKINSLIDVGTGAGFPGIPLKIVYPHLQVTLLAYLFIFRRRMLATKNHLHPRTAQHALSGDDFTLILLGDFAGYRQPYTLPRA